MWYVYVLKSEKDGKLYTGSTNDLKRRLKEHNDGRVESTKDRKPLDIVYYEAGLDEHKARMREQYLKTAWGKRYIKGRI
ncbi:excinuclease ABC subunit C [candidate division WWE3 bacterium CG_4_10_14_0_2_um_filter_41_14]|uniref:Excinuclease ABC subunit C n=1 Tax=candidate division WWE3 bacterium CG_4_10_14_0_2_um_filter_41_14 TaxID=1975072 RepID=A0A2M7TLF7_UNCKA|nr:MAG: excinuclease ABC subunit C [candidate division WWE3 bacterium CG_4_10_14_0_2_um_filter_41_14]